MLIYEKTIIYLSGEHNHNEKAAIVINVRSEMQWSSEANFGTFTPDR